MRRRLRRRATAAACTVVVAVAGMAWAPRTASASVVGSQCGGLTTWSFWPELTLAFNVSTITASYDYECEDAGYLNDFGTRVEQDTRPGTWTNSYPYSGSCVVASFAYGYNFNTGTYEGSGLLVGGAVALATSGNSNYQSAETVEVDVLDNGSPCSEFVASGASETTFEGTF